VPKHKERIGTKQIQTFTILFQNSANYRYLLYWNNPENFSSLSFLIRLYGCFILVHDQSPYKNLFIQTRLVFKKIYCLKKKNITLITS